MKKSLNFLLPLLALTFSIANAQTTDFVAKFDGSTPPVSVNNSLIYDNGTGVGIGSGSATPAAKFQVYDPTSLGTSLNNTTRLTIASGLVGSFNQFKQSQWLRRNTAAGTNWYTVSLHDAVDIDGAFVTPGTDTKTWWERDPYNNSQSWGNAADTYMTLKGGSWASTPKIPTNC